MPQPAEALVIGIRNNATPSPLAWYRAGSSRFLFLQGALRAPVKGPQCWALRRPDPSP